MESSGFIEITTMDEFMEIKMKDEGYIVITDVAHQTRYHNPSCSYVKPHDFQLKVIDNQSKTGSYFWTNDVEFAKSKWDAIPCMRCIK